MKCRRRPFKYWGDELPFSYACHSVCSYIPHCMTMYIRIKHCQYVCCISQYYKHHINTRILLNVITIECCIMDWQRRYGELGCAKSNSSNWSLLKVAVTAVCLSLQSLHPMFFKINWKGSWDAVKKIIMYRINAIIVIASFKLFLK